MTSLNFQQQHGQLILRGDKTHTIRAQRKRPIRPDEPLELFTGLRTCSVVRLFDTHCTKVEPIAIYTLSMDQFLYGDDCRKYCPGDNIVELSGEKLLPHRVRELALADGFESVYEFFRFFLTNDHWQDRGNMGQLIHWAFPPTR